VPGSQDSPLDLVKLSELPVGKSAVVDSLKIEGTMRRRLMDIGLVPGTRVKTLRVSPTGDPRAYRIRGAVIALRSDEGEKVLVASKARDY
jgi:ferrous iron transport protein A